MRLTILTWALASSLAGVAHAESYAGSWDASLGAGVISFDSDRDLDSGPVGSLGLGYRFTEQLGLEGRLSGFEADADAPADDEDGLAYQLDGLYHLNPKGKWQPFFVAGLGQLELDSPTGDDDEFTLNFGAGVKRYLQDNWFLRGDARIYESLDNSNRDAALLVSVGRAFGLQASAPVAAKDSDRDGVIDSQDACPNTPYGEAVDAQGCPVKQPEPAPEPPKDSDGDGVIDGLDACPDTASDLVVDAQGCPKLVDKTVTIRLNVQFDTDQAIVKPDYFSEIERVAEFMRTYPNTQVVIEGHTDSRGAESYNRTLSQQRADAVQRVLVETFAIDAQRVDAKGYGEAQPIASNETAEGRRQNRRVDAVISTQVQVTERR